MLPEFPAPTITEKMRVEEGRKYRKFTILSDSSVPYSVKIKIIIARSMD